MSIKTPTELQDTVAGMTSQDYRERFKAEYDQLSIRMHKLGVMLIKWTKGELDFDPSCPYDLLERQHAAMMDYLAVLEERAQIEGIEL
jgi:hypothetical protein